MTLPRLLVLTDRTQLPAGRTLAATIARCAEAGEIAVVLRELDLAPPERATLAADLVATGVPVIAARQPVPGGAGVHEPADPAYRSPHPGLRGRSCHDEAEVADAVRDAVDYLTISPVAASVSKPGYGPVLGTDGLRAAVARAGDLPVFALGGVEVATTTSLRAAGAYGVAAMSLLMRSPDPAATTAALLASCR